MRLAKLAMATALLLPILGIGVSAYGADDDQKESKQVPTVTFDHLKTPTNTARTVSLADGEPFVIRITHTLPDAFDYQVAGWRLAEDDTPAAAGDLTEDKLLDKDILHKHDRAFAGYEIIIKRVAGIADADVTVKRSNATTTVLEDKRFILTVPTSEWDSEYAGAFTISRLTDPIFALETRTEDGVEKRFVVRDKSAEDDASLGIAAFANVFHTSRPSLAFTFGLGIDERNETTYYLGPSWRFGKKGALTAGVAFGSVKRLPAGVRFDTPVTDQNILNNLGSRIKPEFFIGATLSFLNPGNALQKPFATAASPSPTPPVPENEPPSDDTPPPVTQPQPVTPVQPVPAQPVPAQPVPAQPVTPAPVIDADGDGVPAGEDLDDTNPNVGRTPPGI
jgi:hypothetical protein